MSQKNRSQLTLDQPVVYQVKIPGHLDESWLDWLGEMEIETGSSKAGLPVTILTARLDQAALIGLLRRLYSLGLPLISVVCLEF